jgi:hypothetical protein
MAKAWLRSEVFNGVLPLQATIPQPESPRKHDISAARVVALLSRLRQGKAATLGGGGGGGAGAARARAARGAARVARRSTPT